VLVRVIDVITTQAQVADIITLKWLQLAQDVHILYVPEVYIDACQENVQVALVVQVM